MNHLALDVRPLLLAALAALGALSVGCSSSDSGTTVADTGSGTTADTGGGTCKLSTTCLGPFFGTCFNPSGTCSATGNAVTYSNGAKITKDGATWTATASGGTRCYTVDEVSGAYTFHVGDAVLKLTYEGNQARFVCPDGSIVNFTDSSFGNSECATFVPKGCVAK